MTKEEQEQQAIEKIIKLCKDAGYFYTSVIPITDFVRLKNYLMIAQHNVPVVMSVFKNV